MGGMKALADRLITYSSPGLALRRDQFDKSRSMMGNVPALTSFEDEQSERKEVACCL